MGSPSRFWTFLKCPILESVDGLFTKGYGFGICYVIRVKCQKNNAKRSLHNENMNSTQITYMDKTLRLFSRMLHYYFG